MPASERLQCNGTVVLQELTPVPLYFSPEFGQGIQSADKSRKTDFDKLKIRFASRFSSVFVASDIYSVTVISNGATGKPARLKRLPIG